MNEVSLVIIVILVVLFIRYYSKKRLLLFYSPECGYCNRMKPEWDIFKKEMKNKLLSWIEVKEINVDDRKNDLIVRNFGVSQVPSIFKIEKNGYPEQYAGDRTKERMMEWMTKS